MTPALTTFTGELTRWDDERGFGFLTPLGGGPQAFLHISAIPRSSARPQVGDLLNYLVERTEDGKRRAVQVELVQTTSTARRPPRAPRWARPSSGTSVQRPRSSRVFGVLVGLAIVGLFFAGLFVKDDRWSVPQWAVLYYLAVSILCFIFYVVDKSAAIAGRWRTPESTLLTLGLIGGWPGALLAQQMLRHKIRKRPFMRVFVSTVVVNVAVLVLIATPMGATAVCLAVECG